MENESEMIRQQMDETRTALTDKIEMLEHQVVGTVQAASSTVEETVGNVKEILHDSLKTVKDTVHETVTTVKDTFDLPRQVDRRPWTMFAGATALGYFGSYLLRGIDRRDARMNGMNDNVALAIKAYTAKGSNGAPAGRETTANAAKHASGAVPLSASEKQSWLSHLGDTFHDEISQLKGLAVGTVLGLARDIVTKEMPEHMEHQVEEFLNGITVKLGGIPIHGRILPERPKMQESGKNGNQEDQGDHEQASSSQLALSALNRI